MMLNPLENIRVSTILKLTSLICDGVVAIWENLSNFQPSKRSLMINLKIETMAKIVCYPKNYLFLMGSV